ncbi:MAG: alpha,6-mannosyltransferase [Solirubrobacteraceae bacterium]|jgi:hypothetical protein|nr:alpha,6-mannosyltransferase [Solirubrobacteraceae bacterium]
MPRRIPHLVGRLLALSALGGMLVASWVLATSMSAAAGSWRGGPLHGLSSHLSAPDHRRAIAALGVCYLVTVACGSIGLLPRRATLVTIGVASALFAVAAVVPRSDIYTYLGFARLSVAHGISPYDHGLVAAHADPVFELAVGKWRTGTTPYGPLFTLVTMAAAQLPVAAAAWTLKGVMCAAMLGCVGLVGIIARRLGRDPILAAAFVGLNPAVLVYVLGKGHSDGLMMLPVLLAVLFVVRGHEIAAGASAVVAAGVKITAGVVVPILVIGAGRRGRIAIGIAIGALATGAIAYAAFGAGPIHVLHNARRDQQLVRADLSLFGLVGRGLGVDWKSAAAHHGIEIFLASYALVLVAALVRPRHWIGWSGWAMVALLATSISLWPWYLAWLLPLAALAGDVTLSLAALALTAASIGLLLM